MLTLRTLRQVNCLILLIPLRCLDTLLGFDHFSILGLSCSQHLDLQDCTSERCRSQYNSIFQNIDMLDDLLQHEDSHTQEELIETTSALPSFLDHPVVVDASSFTISERYQQAFAALKTNSNNRNLAVVYQRILKKMKKAEAQLLEHVASMESAKSRVEASLTEISGHIDQKLSRDSVESSGMTTAALALPVVTIHPHHLKWEAIDIKIPAGGVVTLPIPTPILPVTAPSDSQLLILSKQLSVSWAVRSSSSSYIQVSISSPSKDSQSLRFDRLRSEPISPAEVSQRGIQFGYVRSHEDVLSRLGETIVYGQHIIQTSDGNRLLEISNRAVWATITLSYQIEIDNYIAEPMPPRPIMTPKPTRDDPEHLSKLHQLQSVLAQEQERVDSLQHKIDTLQNRLRSMSGPLLLLRETFKAGLFLREKFCSQWEHFHAVESVYRQHLDNHFHLNEPQESIIPTTFDQQSVWLQDIDLIKRAIEEHDDSQPLLLTHLFPPSSPTSAIHVPETEVCSPPESATPTSPRSPQPFAPKDFSAPERILLSSSNLKIRPSSDFRCPIKIPRTTVSSTLYTLSWDFTLLSLSGEELPSQSPDNIDIGFCVLGKSADGSFPLLTPYK